MLEKGLRGFSLSEVDEALMMSPRTSKPTRLTGRITRILKSFNQHHELGNQIPLGEAGANPFTTQAPAYLTHVQVDKAISPLSPEQVQALNNYLEQLPCTWSRNTDARQLP
ncbi:hypothetical protein CVT26_003866 [Gymnopilus dilepis]|uniref:Uncharacterized protein n=1 Tax=Gymnopilus dilepis TaxID=231916 RepID=A0A409YUV4_9AGAR|nr:hypothetical protein CVT26_003866 [Gymnopilus dilepis]